MDRIRIDGSCISSREELFQALRGQLGEDRLMGSNLDALYDVLTSITSHTIIEIRHADQLEDHLGEYWKRILWMINDCLDENENLKLETI